MGDNIFLIIFGIVLTILGVVHIIISLKKNNHDSGKMEQEIAELKQKFVLFENNINKIDPLIRQEFVQNREENQKSFMQNREESLNTLKDSREENQKALKENREELNLTMRSMGDRLVEAQEKIKKETEDKLKDIRETVENKLTTLQEENGKKLDEMRKTVDEKLQESVEKRSNESFKLINERLEAVSQGLGEMQNLATGVGDLKKVLTNVKTRGTYGEVQLGIILEQVLSPEQYVKNDHPDDENGRNVVEYSIKLPGNNDKNEPVFLPIDSKFPLEDYQRMMDAYENNSELIEICGKQFESSVKKAAKDIRETVENKLTTLQEENGKKLDEMRKTVDEKLQESVEKRFNESFKLINERLEAVSQGLGEMQNLATGVGDLKKVLTNVKTRGTYGEVQLGIILEQVLSPEQYVKNDHPDDENGRNVVEYSIKLPGNNDKNEPVFLPIDSKFPLEDYQRMMDAYDNNSELIEVYGKQFEASVKKAAKDIRDKYIKPPKTTDFAVLFVPTEGLYAEILRRPGFFEVLQNDYKVTVVGPTNLVAFLSSLQMGFRTLTIQKRSSEVWNILGEVKKEFKMFGEVLEKTKKKLQEASNVIDQAGTRTRSIERKLKNVQELPTVDVIPLIEEAEEIPEEEELF
jgi:DNA recombination protein RmuC